MKHAIIGFIIGAVYIGGWIASSHAYAVAEYRYAGSTSTPEVILMGSIWPIMLPFVGAMVLFGEDAGIFDSAARAP